MGQPLVRNVMSFLPETMEPSGTTIAGWNAGTFDPQVEVDPVEFEIIEPNTANWNIFLPIPNSEFLLAAAVGNGFVFYEDEIPQELFDIDEGTDCAYGFTSIFGGMTLEQCGWGESSVIGGIVLGDCGVAFNGSVFPPPEPPPPTPPERCPAIADCDIEPELTFLQEVNE